MSQVRGVVLINVYLDLGNSGFGMRGYEQGEGNGKISLRATWERGGRILSQQGGFQVGSHGNCTEEIPVTVNGTDAFVDPISYVIKSAGSPIHCNDVAPPRYKVGGKWYCSYPELKECHARDAARGRGEDRPGEG